MKFFILTLSLISLTLIHAASSASCISHNYYLPEALPSRELVYLCDENPAFGRPGMSGLLEPYSAEILLSNDFTVSSANYKEIKAYTSASSSQKCFYMERQSPLRFTGWNIILLKGFDFDKFSKGLSFVLSELTADNIIPLETSVGKYINAHFSRGGIDHALFNQAYYKSSVNIKLPNGMVLVNFPSTFKQMLDIEGKIYYAPSSLSSHSIQMRNAATMLTVLLSKAGWKNFTFGLYETQKGVFQFAMVKEFGTKELVYAPYGKFINNENAELYKVDGKTLNSSDKLYFSKAKLIVTESNPLLFTGIKYGSTIYTEADLKNNLSEIEGDIPWQSECRNSSDEFTGDELNYPKRTDISGSENEKGSITPISPDNINNTNTLNLIECPDQYTYWDLYSRCVEEMTSEYSYVPDPNDRVDYRDYVLDKLQSERVYTGFAQDGTPYVNEAEKGIMPETPAYYDNKEGKRLNPSTRTKIYDPLDPSTKFYGKGERWEWGLSIKGGEWVERPRWVTDIMKIYMASMRTFFNENISNGKVGVLTFFGQDPLSLISKASNGADTKRSFTQKDGDLLYEMEISDSKYFMSDWKFLNTKDKNLEFKTPTSFIVNSEDARSLSVTYENEGSMKINLSPAGGMTEIASWKKAYVVFNYSIFEFDKYGYPHSIGKIRIKGFVNSQIDGADFKPHLTKSIFTEGDASAIYEGGDLYDLEGRKAHTDLKDLSERDELTFRQKTNALADIALHIAVAEGLDAAMKYLYHNYRAFYEVGKRAENYLFIRMTLKAAQIAYDMYKEHQRLMKILADVRDTYKSANASYENLKRASTLLYDHFANLDYMSLRPTNISKIYPQYAVNYFDFSTRKMKRSAENFELAMHALAYDIDRFNFGPGKMALSYVMGESFNNMATTRYESEAKLSNNIDDYNSTMDSSKSAKNPGEHLRLAKYTKIIIDKTKNTKVKSLSAGTAGLRNVLWGIQAESRDWITMRGYVTDNLAGGPMAFNRSIRDKSPSPIKEQFDVDPVFRNEWVSDQIEAAKPPVEEDAEE